VNRARRRILRIADGWPWTDDIICAHQRIATLS